MLVWVDVRLSMAAGDGDGDRDGIICDGRDE